MLDFCLPARSTLVSILESDSVSESTNSSLLGLLGVFLGFLTVSGSNDTDDDSVVELCFVLPLPLISDLAGIVDGEAASEEEEETVSGGTGILDDVVVGSLVVAAGEFVVILLARLGNISCCFLVN